MLKLTNIFAGYGPRPVLKDISLTINQGEIVTLLGANGAGKTTTFMTICHIVRCSSGSIFFENTPIHQLSTREIVRLGITQVPEGRHIFPRLTVMENLEMGAFLRRNRQEIKSDLDWIFSLFPILKERKDQKGGTLSGGEQQMLAIARGLMAKPKLLLLDEPSLGLAPKFVSLIFEIIAKINREGVTILLVEQNARMALSIAHRGYVLETGRIVLEDTSSRLLENSLVKEAYLGA
ncbi:MAG: ABC transporter ATP-binding protein [candidate division WOR-3 bacterium]